MVWTLASVYGMGLFARGYARNRCRAKPLFARWAAGDDVHPGRLILAKARLRRDLIYFGIAVVGFAIAVGSVTAPRALVGPGIGVALTAIMLAIVVEGHLSQHEDRQVEAWNAPRDPPPRADPPSHERRPPERR